MTQLFSDDGVVTPATTVIKAGPCVVVQRKTVERDGYEAVQLGLVEPTSSSESEQADGRSLQEGQHVPPTRVRREFGLARPGKELGRRRSRWSRPSFAGRRPCGCHRV